MCHSYHPIDMPTRTGTIGGETTHDPDDDYHSPDCIRSMSLFKSRRRVADHGEVFTPAWMVEAMLDLVKGESERIDSRFLEPACGSGNFLVRILQRKLTAVELKFGRSDFERRHTPSSL